MPYYTIQTILYYTYYTTRCCIILYCAILCYTHIIHAIHIVHAIHILYYTTPVTLHILYYAILSPYYTYCAIIEPNA